MTEAKTHKAFVIDKYEEKADGLVLRDVPLPEPSEGQVQIKLHATSVNPVDWKLRKGYLKNYPTKFPVCLGWDISGRISAVGYGVHRFKVGDEVYAYGRRESIGLNFGTFCEYSCVPESFIALKPKNIDFVQAASVPLVGLTAFQCVIEKGQVKKDEKVVIFGASGGVGTFGTQYCKILGAEVIAVASTKNHEYLKGLGATHCIDYKSDVAEEIKKIAPEGVDKVMDFFGGDSLKIADKVSKKGATYISIATWSYSSPEGKDIHYDTVFVVPNAVQLEQIARWLEEGVLKVEINKVYDFKDTVKALEEIESSHGRGKIAVKIV